LTHVVVEQNGLVGTLRLARPEARNALSNEVLAQIGDGLRELDAAQARCVVVLGSDRVFASGADLRALAQTEALEYYFGERHALWDAVRQTRVPLVAAVAGYCLGGGFELALACDIVIAADNAAFGLPETTLGLVPGAGGTQRLVRAVGKSTAMEMILAGRRLSGQEAVALGVASRVVALEELEGEAMRVASDIASRSSVALKLAKESVNRAFDMPLEAGLELERRAFALALASDAAEGIAAFLEKREPGWRHPA
jgi:enoyl-CoA hydratase